MLHYKACARTRKQKIADIALMVFGLGAAAYTTIQTVRVRLLYLSHTVSVQLTRIVLAYDGPSARRRSHVRAVRECSSWWIPRPSVNLKYQQSPLCHIRSIIRLIFQLFRAYRTSPWLL